MAKHRIVNTRFWDDSYIVRLTPNEKLVFLYLLTNPLTTIAGVYEIPTKRAVFDIGLSTKEISLAFAKLERDGKIVRHEDWIGLVNFIKHQSLNPKVRQGMISELGRAPSELVAKLPVKHSLSIGFDSLSHLNLNTNFNLNPKGTDVNQRHPTDVGKAASELARRMRVGR